MFSVHFASWGGSNGKFIQYPIGDSTVPEFGSKFWVVPYLTKLTVFSA